jgi:hypothetical protein
MTSNVVSFPRELTRGSSSPGWRSIGEAADRVLGRVAYRSGIASNVSPILREEGGEWAENIPFAAPVG